MPTVDALGQRVGPTVSVWEQAFGIGTAHDSSRESLAVRCRFERFAPAGRVFGRTQWTWKSAATAAPGLGKHRITTRSGPPRSHEMERRITVTAGTNEFTDRRPLRGHPDLWVPGRGFSPPAGRQLDFPPRPQLNRRDLPGSVRSQAPYLRGRWPAPRVAGCESRPGHRLEAEVGADV